MGVEREADERMDAAHYRAIAALTALHGYQQGMASLSMHQPSQTPF